ncbi:MAG: 50S ribosomal protein L10 [Nitrospirae bacterium]|nr:MAG: 50S ribosomal protein L10 [Leptospirillum sp. Group IV 'UBA BS']MCL4484787.1 50S ribosomal protein L10 [Nitrospirota bacterium]MCL5284415.1 50S ribosomal protein L10 [Nitrospirota bacterium]
MANKAQKTSRIEHFRKVASTSSVTVVAEYKGLNVEKLSTLRRSLQTHGGQFTVYKNTLARIGTETTSATPLVPDMKGQVGYVFSENNPLGVIKTLIDYSKENPLFKIKSGVFDGQKVSYQELIELSKVPDRKVLYGQLLGLLQSPLSSFVGGLQQILRKSLYALEERKKQLGN